MIHISRTASRTLAVVFLVITLSMLNTGCSTYHIYQIGGPEGRELGNQPGTEWKGKTLHSLAWGGIRQDLPVANCRLGSGQRLGIEEVKVETNLGYALISVATLGFWVPIEVSWRCAKPPVITDLLD